MSIEKYKPKIISIDGGSNLPFYVSLLNHDSGEKNQSRKKANDILHIVFEIITKGSIQKGNQTLS